MAKITNSADPEPEPDTDKPAVLPTEQFETTPAPVSASASVSGGATGLTGESRPITPRENLNIFHRHPLASGIVAGILAVIVVSSLTAWGVGAAVTASLTSQTSAVAPPSSATPAPQGNGVQGGRLAAGHIAFRGTIQHIDDSTWTILTRRGQKVSVTINASTQFGTKKMAETQGSFAVGDTVLIVATEQNGGATAVRVASAGDTGATPTASPTPSATT